MVRRRPCVAGHPTRAPLVSGPTKLPKFLSNNNHLRVKDLIQKFAQISPPPLQKHHENKNKDPNRDSRKFVVYSVNSIGHCISVRGFCI
ncbi:hypothetical protein L6164_016307 [Bauhinia variegata]|uniref:Uncharacterized protein n=1 Tax=Bauhinia variegata TaxID=167791 RepID=A0ACB9NN98_BAUVA|nr:hypothetical protein L6164_016307 [Bauhinia variegata]